MGLHEIKRLLQSKGHDHQTEDMAHKMGFASYTSDRELITRT
jgi:hypothetical protein